MIKVYICILSLTICMGMFKADNPAFNILTH